MNDRLELWSKLVASGKLTREERLRLEESLRAQPQWISELYDDRSVDRLIALLGETESRDAFTRKCLSAFWQEHQSDRPEEAAAQAVGGIAESQLPTAPILKRPSRRSSAIWATGLLALATLLVIGLFIAHYYQVNTPDVPNGNIAGATDSTEPGRLPELEFRVPAHDHEKLASDEPGMIAPVDSNEIELPELDGNPSGAGKVIAELFVSDDARFENERGRQVGAGIYKLSQGQAVFQLDSGVSVFMQGPAELELVAANQIRPIRGKVLVESESSDIEPFTVDWRDASIEKLISATVMIDVDESGSQINLSKGKLALNQSPDSDEAIAVELGKDGLQNAFVNNTSNQLKENPKVLIAHGMGDRYLAQIGVGSERKETTEPNEFDEMVQGWLNPTNTAAAQNQLRSQVIDFNRRLRQLQDQFEQIQAPGSQSGVNDNFLPSPFRNGNGVRFPFSNSREFQKFKEDLQRRVNF